MLSKQLGGQWCCNRMANIFLKSRLYRAYLNVVSYHRLGRVEELAWAASDNEQQINARIYVQKVGG